LDEGVIGVLVPEVLIGLPSLPAFLSALAALAAIRFCFEADTALIISFLERKKREKKNPLNDGTKLYKIFQAQGNTIRPSQHFFFSFSGTDFVLLLFV
jgi:predicted DNA repair protein MutK